MRKLLALLAILSGVASAQSPVSVTGLIKTPTNTAASFGTVTFKLQPFNSSIAYRVAGQVMIGPIQSVCGIDASGHLKSNADLVSACQVWGNDVISPTGTAYEVIESPNNGPGQDFTNALIQGASLDLSNLTFVPSVRVFPDLTSLTLSPLTVSLIPNADNLYSLGSGGDRFSQAYINNLFVNNVSVPTGGALAAPKLNNVVVCDTTFGSDIGLVLADAQSRLPSTGGIIDCTSEIGNQTLNTVFQAQKNNISILWGQINLTTLQAGAVPFSVQANGFAMHGQGPGITTITMGATGKNALSVSFGLNTTLTGITIDGISLVGASGNSGVVSTNGAEDAISLTSTSVSNTIAGVNIFNDEFSGFANNAVRCVQCIDPNVHDNFIHNIAGGIRVKNANKGSITNNTIRDSSLVNTFFNTIIVADGSTVAPFAAGHNVGLTIANNKVYNEPNAECVLAHDLSQSTITGNIFNGCILGIGVGTFDGSDAVSDNTILGNSVQDTLVSGLVSGGNYCISMVSAGTVPSGNSIIGNTMTGCNAVVLSAGQGAIGLNTADNTTIIGNVIHDAYGNGIAINGNNVTRVNIRGNNIKNILAATGGNQNGIFVQAGSTGDTGRIEGNWIDTVVNGISLNAVNAGLLIGPNDFSSVSGSNITNVADATLNTSFPGTLVSSGSQRGSQQIGDQGAVCTNGELALSAGWQSTGSATATGVVGTGQTCEWTITTGTTTAANPTVTDTLTNALPSASTVCWMIITGGNRTAAAADSFDQTTLSATAPIFTFQGTPTAGGKTYKVVRTCGP